MKLSRKSVPKSVICLAITVVCCYFLLSAVVVSHVLYTVLEDWTFSHNILLEPNVSDSWLIAKSILVCVTSAPGNIENRDVIRRTWATHPSLRVVFFLGFSAENQLEIIEEQRKHGDIVQYDYDDAYRNLTLKTVSMIDWAHRNQWEHRTHVIKIDDDTFLNPNVFQTYIGNFSKRAVYGKMFRRANPVRDPSNKYYISEVEYRPSKFPDYLCGALYVIHESALSSLYKTMFKVKPLAMEDVYLTGFVAKHANVTIVDLPDFAKVLDGPNDGENFLKIWFYDEVSTDVSKVLGVHDADADLQLAYWEQIESDRAVA